MCWFLVPPYVHVSCKPRPWLSHYGPDLGNFFDASAPLPPSTPLSRMPVLSLRLIHPTCPRISRVMRVTTKIIQADDEMGELYDTEIAPSGSRGDAACCGRVGSFLPPFVALLSAERPWDALVVRVLWSLAGDPDASWDASSRRPWREPSRHQVCPIACYVRSGRFLLITFINGAYCRSVCCMCWSM